MRANSAVVHPHLVPVRRGAGRDVALDGEQRVVAVGADELAEDVVDALQGAAGVLQRDDGVVEGRRLRLVRDRGDLGLVLGEGALVGRHEMLGLDAGKRRRAERRVPGLEEGILSAALADGRFAGVMLELFQVRDFRFHTSGQ